MTLTSIDQANWIDIASSNYEVDDDLCMTLPEGPDSIKQSTAAVNQAAKICTEDWKWASSIITAISQSQISLQKDLTWRLDDRIRGPHVDKSLSGDGYQMAHYRIIMRWLNSLLKDMANQLFEDLSNSYRKAAGYSTKAVYRADRQTLPNRPRFTEIPALLKSASTRRLS
jgi:hypothetical protein